MHDIIQKKSKDRNVSYRGYIPIQEIGVLWIGFEGKGGGVGLNSTFIKADKMKKETKHTYPTYTADLCRLL